MVRHTLKKSCNISFKVFQKTDRFGKLWIKGLKLFQQANLVKKLKETLWPLFMDGVQLPQEYRATTRRQFTFYYEVPRNSWHSFDQPRKDEFAFSLQLY